MPKQANLRKTKTLGARRTSWHPSQLQVLLGLSSTVKAGLVRRVHGNVQHSCGWNLQAPWKVDVPTFGFELLGRVWMDPNTTTNIAATCLRINQKLQLVVCKGNTCRGKIHENPLNWPRNGWRQPPRSQHLLALLHAPCWERSRDGQARPKW